MAENYLVKPITLNWRTLRAYLDDLVLLDVNHHIYVPGKFVFGNLKERREGFVLSGIFYRDSKEELKGYQEDIDAGKLEIVAELNFNDETLDILRSEGSAVYQAKKRLDALIGSTHFRLSLLSDLLGRTLGV